MRRAGLICIYMRDGAIHYKLYGLLKLTMAVDNIIVFRIIKGAYQSLMYMCLCTIPSNGHTSLSTALVK